MKFITLYTRVSAGFTLTAHVVDKNGRGDVVVMASRYGVDLGRANWLDLPFCHNDAGINAMTLVAKDLEGDAIEAARVMIKRLNNGEDV